MVDEIDATKARLLSLDWEKILKYVKPNKQVAVRDEIFKYFGDVVTTNHPIIVADGRLRFKADPMVTWIMDVAMRREGTDLNAFWNAARARYGGRWSKQKVKQFYRDMGYSLDGFGEVFSGIGSKL